MDIAALQQELEALPVDKQDQVAAFLTSLRLKRDGTMDKIRRRMDDGDSSEWIEWGEAKQRLGLEDGESGR